MISPALTPKSAEKNGKNFLLFCSGGNKFHLLAKQISAVLLVVLLCPPFCPTEIIYLLLSRDMVFKGNELPQFADVVSYSLLAFLLFVVVTLFRVQFFLTENKN